MRLVLDTNVVVSALLWGGMPYRLLQRAVEGEAELFTSPILIAELADVLQRRPHLIAKLTEKGMTVASITALYLNFTQIISPLTSPRVVPNDPDDDHVISCAVFAKADAIVSGDRHLLDLHEYQGIHIVTVAEIIKSLIR